MAHLLSLLPGHGRRPDSEVQATFPRSKIVKRAARGVLIGFFVEGRGFSRAVNTPSLEQRSAAEHARRLMPMMVVPARHA